MAATLALTADEFEDKVLKSDVPVLIDFWAEWCGPCLMIAPHVEALATEYEGRAKVYKVDVDKERDLAARYGIASIPTLLVFKDGKLMDQMNGAVPRQQMQSALDRVL